MDLIYQFDWDQRKARSNLQKHDVSFERATTVFRDPHLLSIPDLEHSGDEERWVTIGMDVSGNLLVLVHTFGLLSADLIAIRIISARKVTKSEKEQYEKGI